MREFEDFREIERIRNKSDKDKRVWNRFNVL